MEIPESGIVVDAAHSMKRGVTEFQGFDLTTGKRLFYRDIGNKTVNIGEFLAVVEAVKYIIENDHRPRVIYTDSSTAITWFKEKRATSKMRSHELSEGVIFLKALAWDIETIEVRHWDNDEWGENPADFNNK